MRPGSGQVTKLFAEAAKKSDCWKHFNVPVTNLEICEAARDLGQEVPLHVVSDLVKDESFSVKFKDADSELVISHEEALLSQTGRRSLFYFDSSAQHRARDRSWRLGILIFSSVISMSLKSQQ